MKARPRSVEREVARALSRFFVQNDLSPVERIPVLGRTGPDLTSNELGLVIDVKSRLEVPRTPFTPYPIIVFDEELKLVGVRLKDLPLLVVDTPVTPIDFSSTLVRRWYLHMQEWTLANHPNGISALVLHRPKMPIGAALLILSHENRRRLITWKTLPR